MTKAYWANRRLIGWYTKDEPYRRAVAERILSEKPRSVLEFGCNAGRTLMDIREKDATVRLTGVDINPPAIAWAREHLPSATLVLDDEGWLAKQPPDAWDVAFTVSVLDHLPKVDAPLAHLSRIARTLILVEPWTGGEGDVRAFGIEPRSPSWSWDLTTRLRAMGRTVTSRAFPIGDEGMAATYRLYTARRKR